MRQYGAIYNSNKKRERIKNFGSVAHRKISCHRQSRRLHNFEKKEELNISSRYPRGDSCRSQIRLSRADFNATPSALEGIKVSRPRATDAHRISATIEDIAALYYFDNKQRQQSMASSTTYVVTILIILGIVYEALGVIDDSDRNVLGLNFPYGRGLDSELQLARLLLLPQRLCHPKRNSELINSLLGLPKNMNNAGK